MTAAPIPITNPAGDLKTPAGFSSLFPHLAGSVSELRPSEINATTRRRSLPALLIDSARPPVFPSHLLKENGNGTLIISIRPDVYLSEVQLAWFNPGSICR